MSLHKTRSLLCLAPSHHDPLVRITTALHPRERLRLSRHVEKNRHRTPSQRVSVPRSGNQTTRTSRPRRSRHQSTRSHRQTARHRLQPRSLPPGQAQGRPNHVKESRRPPPQDTHGKRGTASHASQTQNGYGSKIKKESHTFFFCLFFLFFF